MLLSYKGLRQLALGLTLVAGASLPCSADMVQITVTNNQPGNGFAISPVWVGVGDGTFTTFSNGGTASSSVQSIAELGDSSGLTSSFAGQGAQTTVGSAPILSGGTASKILDIANPSADRYVSLAAMVVPSNDFFFGNADPKSIALFDSSGHFNGPLTVQIFGSNGWNAGTEVNNINFGAAFIVGDNAHDHVAANGLISPVFGGSTDFSAYLNSIYGKATPAGYNIGHLISANDLIATIQFSAVPEPSTFALSAIGLIAVAGHAWKRRAAKNLGSPS